MDEKIKGFLSRASDLSDGRLAPEYLPEFIDVGEPGGEILRVGRVCRSVEEWVRKHGRNERPPAIPL